MLHRNLCTSSVRRSALGIPSFKVSFDHGVTTHRQVELHPLSRRHSGCRRPCRCFVVGCSVHVQCTTQTATSWREKAVKGSKTCRASFESRGRRFPDTDRSLAGRLLASCTLNQLHKSHGNGLSQSCDRRVSKRHQA